MQRIKSIDLARGFTVLFIPLVHSVMVYCDQKDYDSIIVTILSFIAKWPGAQVFMLLMGVSFALTGQRNFKRVAKRSIVLLVVGYALNALKFVIPYLFGGLPASFLHEMNANSWVSLLVTGDIFHFAALSLLILYVVKRLPEYPVIAILLSIAVCFGSAFWWDLCCNNFLLDHLLGLVSGAPPKVFFPLLPWIVYPLAGLAIGHYLKQCIVSTYVALFFLGLAMFFISSSIYMSIDVVGSFYRTGARDTLRHIGFVGVWVSLSWIATVVFPDNGLFRFLTWCSKNITLIYVLQWPIVFWLVPFIGYQSLTVCEAVFIGVVITAVVFLLTVVIRRWLSYS